MAQGAIRVGGFELVPVTASFPASNSGPAFAVSLKELRLADLQATIEDNALRPPGQIKAILSDLSVKPRPGGETLDVTGKLAAPGIAKSVQLDGVIQPLAAVRSAKLNLHVEGIHPDALAPYLASLGLQSELKDASFAGAMDVTASPDAKGNYTAAAKLRGIRFADGGELLGMEQVNITGVGIDPTGLLHVDSVDLSGPSVELTRDADGSIAGLGLRFRPSLIAPSASSTTSSKSSAQLSLPRVEIGSLTWKNAKLAINDRATPGATGVAIENAEVDVKNLLLDLTDQAKATKTGSLHVQFTSPQLAPGGMTIDGTLTPGPSSLAADLKVRGQKLQTQALTPYLKTLGIEPTLTDGTLALDAKLGLLGGQDGSISGSIDASNIVLHDASDELLGVDEFKIDSLSLNSNQLQLGNVLLRHPRGRALREADGKLVAAGVRIDPTVIMQALSGKPSAEPSTQPAAAAMTGTLKQLQVQNAQFQWTDQAVSPNVNTTAFVSADVSNLTLGKHGSPGTFNLQLSCEGILGDMKVSGLVDATPGAESVKLDINGSGIHGAPIDGYLPAGLKTTVMDGRIRTTILVSSDLHPQGGRGAWLDVKDLDWRDGDSTPLLSLDLARVAASRIDLNGDVIAVDELSLAGLETSASLGSDGRPHLLGLTTTPTVVVPADQRAQIAAAIEIPTTNPSLAADTSSEIAKTVADARRPMPQILVGKLDLDVRKLTLTDDRRPAAAPLVLSNIRLRSPEPIAIGGKFADAQPPAKIELTGTIDPLVGQFTLAADAAGLANEPVMNVDLSASGIRGDGVTGLVPELSNWIDGSQMQDGRFHVAAQMHLKFDRRGPRDFDLSRGFNLELAVKNLSFRDRDGGRSLAGVDGVDAEKIQVYPQDAKIQIKSIEITKPILYASREKDGIHVLGLVVKLPHAPTTAPAVVNEPSLAPPPVVAQGPTTQPSGEIRIDRLLISGIDLRLEDHAVDPPMTIPVNSLDVEVRDLTTAALYEDRPIRFSAVAAADKVSLPKHSKGTPTTQEFEDRELFSQVTTSGSMSLYPVLHGYTKTSISGVELGAFKGEAGALGVDLSAGIFDADINTRFHDDGSLDLQSRFTATDLKLTEPANGPIQQHMGLSAPLDVVLPALTDPDGGITIPLNMTIEKGKVSSGAIVGAASGAVLSITTTAIASAPVKAVNGVTGIVGFNLFGKPKGPTTVDIAFEPGDASLSPEQQAQIAALIKQLKDDQNTQVTLRSNLGGGDQSMTEGRANPTAADCLALATQLRNQRAELASQRAALAAHATAELASSASTSDATLQQLRQLDVQIAHADDAMDHLYNLLKPGASRQATRRTRAACLEIAEKRLKIVNDALLAANLPNATDRINKTSATFNPTDDDAGGAVNVTVIQKKREQ